MNKKALRLFVWWVMMIFITLLTSCGDKKPKHRNFVPNPTIATNETKKLSKNDWSRFSYAVSECRIVINEDTFLERRAWDYWERLGIEPAVGYTAWLFQESRFNGRAVGDNGKAHGYGQIHPPALQEMNEIRKKRGEVTYEHDEIHGRSRERVRFFLHAFHDYVELCARRYKRRRSLDADLNAWNGGPKRTTEETKYSGQIKYMVIQYYKRLAESQKKKASAKR